jgi:hypothetical protein
MSEEAKTDETIDQSDPAPTERKPSAIDLKIRDLKRQAHFFKAVADGDGADKSSSEYLAHRRHMVALTIGSAIGIGNLYRNHGEGEAPSPAAQLKTLRSDARWFAAAAASNLEIEKGSAAYTELADAILDSAIATATGCGRLRAPNRSFTQAVEEQRAEAGQSEGRFA